MVLWLTLINHLLENLIYFFDFLFAIPFMMHQNLVAFDLLLNLIQVSSIASYDFIPMSLLLPYPNRLLEN